MNQLRRAITIIVIARYQITASSSACSSSPSLSRVIGFLALARLVSLPGSTTFNNVRSHRRVGSPPRGYLARWSSLRWSPAPISSLPPCHPVPALATPFPATAHVRSRTSVQTGLCGTYISTYSTVYACTVRLRPHTGTRSPRSPISSFPPPRVHVFVSVRVIYVSWLYVALEWSCVVDGWVARVGGWTIVYSADY